LERLVAEAIRRGEIKNFAGIDSPTADAEALAEKIVDFLEAKGRLSLA
jgi:hypothetical protein